MSNESKLGDLETGISEITSDREWLEGLVGSPSLLKSMLREKNSAFDYRSEHHVDVEYFVTRGWEIAKEGKRSVRMKRRKARSAQLEDRAWKLLYRMGYPALNPRRFEILFERDSGSIGKKQIDAFGIDGETAIVIECKARDERGRRSLAKDIAETASLQNYIRNSIDQYHEGQPKRKVIWLYITENIIWSDADLERAEDAGIYVTTENELQYFEAFLRHIGPAGKYQILGEFLKGQKIPALQGRKVPAVRGRIGGERFYSFVTTPRSLLKIAFVNHQALNHPDGQPAYQRMISSGRIKQIAEFLTKKSGFFPTNLLINFVTNVRFDLLENKDNSDPNIKFGWLTLPATYRSAWIIDGQHRLFGYSGLDDKYLDQSIFVIAFEQMKPLKEADLFITINHKQKSVPKALLTALLADLKIGDSDPKVAISALASAVVRRLNNDRSGPLSLRFALPDMPAGPGQNLTIPEAVNGLTRSNLIGRVLHGAVAPGPLSGGTDDETIERARRVLNGYFDALREANPTRWEAGRSGFMCTNPAVRAHLTLIGEMSAHLSAKRGVDFFTLDPSGFVAEIVQFADPIFGYFATASDDDVRENYSRKFGEGGVKEYLYNLSELVLKSDATFGSEEFRRYIAQRESSQADEANHFLMKLSENLTDYIVAALKSKYGTHRLDSGEVAYWELGVPNRKIAEAAYRKHLEDTPERRKPKEAYLEILELKQIVEEKDNWPFFEQTLSVALPTERQGSKKYHTGWIALFNDVRKIAAHKSALRTYTDEDLEFVDWLRGAIAPRIERELERLA